MPSLTEDDKIRYSRHLLIDGFTPGEQQKIKEAKILVIGAGGLGTPVLLYLVGAGVGKIGIVEFDTVDLSNLHRQVIYNNIDIGTKKTEPLLKKLRALNPECRFTIYAEKWSEQNARSIATNYDILVDCTDSLDTRYLSDEVSQALELPMVYGAVYQLEGQVAVFNFKGSKTYRDLFPKPHTEPQHNASGVLGPVAGLIGSMQAAEALKIVTGIGEVLSNKMACFSLKYNRYKILEF